MKIVEVAKYIDILILNIFQKLSDKIFRMFVITNFVLARCLAIIFILFTCLLYGIYCFDSSKEFSFLLVFLMIFVLIIFLIFYIISFLLEEWCEKYSSNRVGNPAAAELFEIRIIFLVVPSVIIITPIQVSALYFCCYYRCAVVLYVMGNLFSYAMCLCLFNILCTTAAKSK